MEKVIFENTLLSKTRSPILELKTTLVNAKIFEETGIAGDLT